jgi:predicted amidohydrolase YtcJ
MRMRPASLVLGIALVISACGGEGSPTSATTSPPASTAPSSHAPASPTASPTASPSATPPPPADLVARGGPILTMTRAGTAQAIAVRDGVIVAVGSEAEVAAYVGPGTRTLDLAGRALMPGFVDAHTHLLSDMGLAVLDAQQLALESGITSLADASVEPELLDRYLEASDGLIVRVSLYLGRTTYCGEDMGTWYETYPPGTDFGTRLSLAGVKIFADGGACRRLAASKPFIDGVEIEPPFFKPRVLAELVRTANDAGYQVLVHAQGDRAVRDAQDAIEAALDGRPNTLRHRIDHNAIVTPDLRTRYGEIGIVPVVFGSFPTCADVAWTPFWKANGEDWRSLLDANPGLPIAWHGDDPAAAPASPLHDLASYVTRADVAEDGTLCLPSDWLADNAITVTEALQMMTVNAAYAIGRDDRVGSLAPGMLADLVVLSADPTAIVPEALFDLSVVATIVGGEVVYCHDGEEELCG